MRQNFTIEMIEDLQLCMDDPAHFISTHLEIDAAGIEDIDPDEFMTQAPTLQTEQLCAYALWYAIFRGEQTQFFVSKGRADRSAANETARRLHKMLPKWLQPAITRKLKTRLEFMNGSRIYFEIASPVVGKGFTISLATFDKYGEYDVDTREQMMMNLMPTMCYGGRVIICGTDEQLNY